MEGILYPVFTYENVKQKTATPSLLLTQKILTGALPRRGGAGRRESSREKGTRHPGHFRIAGEGDR
jgi:hypothetical protein